MNEAFRAAVGDFEVVQRNLVPKHEGFEITLNYETTHDSACGRPATPRTHLSEQVEAREPRVRTGHHGSKEQQSATEQERSNEQSLASDHRHLCEFDADPNDPEAEVHVVQGQSSEVLPCHSGWLHKPGKIGEVALQVRQLQNWANKIAGFRDEWKKEERANHQGRRIAVRSRRCDRARRESLMARGHFWLAEPMKEIGTEMNEQTMEKLVTAAWKETEHEHKNHVAERVKRRNEKLNEAYSSKRKNLHQWIRQDYQTLIATMKKADGSITMNFQEISDFEEHFGRFIPSEPMDAKRVTGVELRHTIQRWSNNAAAGADSWKRCEWKQFTDTMYDQVAEYLNTSRRRHAK